MKQLIWKELREQRFIPVAMCAMMIVGLAVWYASSAWLAAHNQGTALKLEETGMALVIAMWLPGLFAGSGAVAPEIGQGTLQFLSTLPTGRRRIWGAKVIAGVATSCVSMLSVLVGYLIAILFLYGLVGLRHGMSLMTHPTSDEPQLLFSAVIFCLYGYAVSLFVSTLVDRTVVAVAVGLISALVCYVGFSAWTTTLRISWWHEWESAVIVILMTVALTAAFLAASYVAFSGPSLLSGARVRRGTAALACGLVGVVICVLVTVWSIERAEASEPKTVPVAFTGETRYEDEVTSTNFPYMAKVSVTTQSTLRRPVNVIVFTRGSGNMQTEMQYGHDEIDRSQCKMSGLVEPVSTRNSSEYVNSSVIRPGHINIRAYHHPTPGHYTDSVYMIDKDGRTVGEIDVDNITQ